MSKISRDQVLLELMEFFLEENVRDESNVREFLVQGDYDADQFIAAVQSLRATMRRLLGD